MTGETRPMNDVTINEDPEDHIQSLIDQIQDLDNLLSPAAQELIRSLRYHTVTDDVYDELAGRATRGDQLADRIAIIAGSWPFLIGFALLMTVWIGLNVIMGLSAFDPYPFILLNLALSTLAAIQAPVIMMSQNRQAKKDRAVARNDFEVNIKTELEIADLHRKLDKIMQMLEMQHQRIDSLAGLHRPGD